MLQQSWWTIAGHEQTCIRWRPSCNKKHLPICSDQLAAVAYVTAIDRVDEGCWLLSVVQGKDVHTRLCRPGCVLLKQKFEQLCIRVLLAHTTPGSRIKPAVLCLQHTHTSSLHLYRCSAQGTVLCSLESVDKAHHQGFNLADGS